MLNVFRNDYLSLVFSISLLVTVALLVTGCEQDLEQSSLYHKINGPIKVSYKFKTTDTGGMVASEEDVSEILMFEQYIIVKKKNGKSSLIPIAKVAYFHWH